ncbi:MAG: cation diffusion facilitator family transporter [Geminicoccaceae bacterium]
MAHDHGHAHGHAGHDHAHGGTADRTRLGWALALTAGFMLVEVAGGLISGSLALIADAGHMLTDAAALALALYASHAAKRPPTPERSYGHARAEVLAALVNAGALFAVTAWIVVEAAGRLMDPAPIQGGWMMAVAAAGLAANVAAWFILNGGSGMNVEGAALHVLSDMLGSAGAIAAAGIILLTGWTPIDPILSVFVALLILRGAWSLASRSWHVLMEGAPEGLDVPALRRELVESIPGVCDVHHVHAWSLTPERRLVTLHATLIEGHDHDEVLRQLRLTLAERWDLHHATIQLERGACADQHGHAHAHAH